MPLPRHRQPLGAKRVWRQARPLNAPTLGALGTKLGSRKPHCLFSSCFTTWMGTLTLKGKHGLEREDGGKGERRLQQRINNGACFPLGTADMQAFPVSPETPGPIQSSALLP